MAEPRNFGTLSSIDAEAIGQPGQRRFRLRAISDSGSAAAIWLEKEQLGALGEAIESVLEGEGYLYERLPLDDLPPEPVFPLNADLEFRAGQLQMGLNREARQIVLIVAEATAEGDPEPEATSFAFDYRRAHELRGRIADVVAAGRKPCPLCTAPLDPAGHVCVRTNGHHPH